MENSTNVSLYQVQNNQGYYVIPNDTMKILKTICFLGLTPALVICGLVLNSLCVVLFYKVPKKTSTVIMLSALTVADILFLLNGAVNSIMMASTLYGRPLDREQNMAATLIFSTYINTVPTKIGNCLTLCISVERLFSVLMPLKIRRYSSRKCAIIVVFSITIFTMIACVPNLFLYEMGTVVTNTTGITKTQTFLRYTEYGKNENLSNAAYVAQETLLYFVPVFGVLFTSIATILILVVQSRRRASMSTGSENLRMINKENHITKMLLIVSSFFVVCKLPGTIERMYIFIDPDQTPYRYENNIHEATLTIFFVLILSNSVVNFIIYYKASTNYRNIIQKMFRKGFRKRKKDVMGNSSSALGTINTIA